MVFIELRKKSQKETTCSVARKYIFTKNNKVRLLLSYLITLYSKAQVSMEKTNRQNKRETQIDIAPCNFVERLREEIDLDMILESYFLEVH